MEKVQSTGKKKTSIASSIIKKSSSPSFVVNGRDISDYFFGFSSNVALSPFKEIGEDLSNFAVVIKVCGGGVVSQAYAVRQSLSKALSQLFPEKRSIVKSLGFLTRDARVVERKKPGLRKARKQEQYSKR